MATTTFAETFENFNTGRGSFPKVEVKNTKNSNKRLKFQ
jgi:hypothetical protein